MEFGIKHIKKIKLFVWFFIAILLDVTFMHNLMIFSAKPYLTYTLLVLAMLFEYELSYAMTLAFLVSLMCASLMGQSFGFEVLFVMAASLLAFTVGKKARYIPELITAGVMAAVFVVMHIVFSLVINDGIHSLHSVGNIIVANAVYAFLVGALLFNPFNKSVYTKDTKKLFL